MDKKISLRRCVGCGKMIAKKELFRIVKTPAGAIFLDRSGKEDGRGAYLCKNMECVKKAAKNRGLERSFKSAVPKSVLESLIYVDSQIGNLGDGK